MVLSHKINLVHGDAWVSEGPTTFPDYQDAETWEEPNTVKIVRHAF